MASILIIGGANGLGGAIARTFADAGDHVTVADEGPAPPGLGGMRFVAVELAAVEAVHRAVAAVAQDGLDALVIAASAMASAPIAEWTPAMWDRAAAINLRLPFFAVQAALPWLRASSQASVTIVSSTAALRGQPFTHAYQATKAGVAGLVRSLTAELGPEGIRVNAVLGGWLETPLTEGFWATRPPGERTAIDARIPLRRHGTAGETAAVVHFLASPAAGYLTGAMLPVDGGDTAV